MGLSRLQTELAQELDLVLGQAGFRRRGQVWRKGDAAVRLRVAQATSCHDAIVRFQVEFDAPPDVDYETEPVWFLMSSQERAACVQFQHAVLQRTAEAAREEEVAAMSTILKRYPTEAWTENWLVLTSKADAQRWAELLSPTVHRHLGVASGTYPSKGAAGR